MMSRTEFARRQIDLLTAPPTRQAPETIIPCSACGRPITVSVIIDGRRVIEFVDQAGRCYACSQGR